MSAEQEDYIDQQKSAPIIYDQSLMFSRDSAARRDRRNSEKGRPKLQVSTRGYAPRRSQMLFEEEDEQREDEEEDEGEREGEEEEEEKFEDVDYSDHSDKGTRFQRGMHESVIARSTRGKKRKMRSTNTRRGATRTFDDQTGGSSLVIPLQGRSFFLFSPRNSVRLFCAATVSHKYFDPFVLTMICISTMMLTLENPLNDPNGGLMEFLQYMDYVFTTIFVIECVLKNIQTGFVVNGRHSYIRNAWNVIDFMIVAFSLISVFSLGVDLKFIKAFRMIRVLRPLRVISRNEGLKIAVQSLLNAIPDVLNVLVISGLFFTLFGIFGTNYFKGQFSYCLFDNVAADLQEGLRTKWDCLNAGGEWLSQDSTFDNVFRSILSLFIMSTTEGWVAMMWNGVDATGINLQPQRDESIYWVFFFILFIMFGSQFIMNLFVGVVINTFDQESKRLGKNHLLSDTQKEWI